MRPITAISRAAVVLDKGARAVKDGGVAVDNVVDEEAGRGKDCDPTSAVNAAAWSLAA